MKWMIDHSNGMGIAFRFVRLKYVGNWPIHWQGGDLFKLAVARLCARIMLYYALHDRKIDAIIISLLPRGVA